MTTPTMKVVFPAPPPTTNELTPLQRTQLVRKTKKIEQLLGTTPHLIDMSIKPPGPIRISLPYDTSRRRLTKTRRASIDSTTSSSSSGSLSSPVQRSSSVSSSISPRRVKTDSPSSRCSTPTITSIGSNERWPSNGKTPMLRLAMESLTLETIQASPLPTVPHSHMPPKLHNSPRNSLVLDSATFIIPTQNSLRKKKMDRLRKKLGSDVPFDLVFPKDSDTDEASENSPPPSRIKSTRVNRDKECPPLPAPVPRARKSKAPRISNTRDSIVDAASIHRAKRQPQRRPRPPSGTKNFKRVNQRLSLIIESPDEHGAGCTEEFGLHVSRIASNEFDDADVLSEWFGTEIKLWSTRKGYEGWNNSTTAPAVSANATLELPFGSRGTVERKKRPSSYRKPPPPLPVVVASNDRL
ncbi:hypothetical protein BDZ97DRAFT_1905782 [Flammula alnicola]|nr:hypothetical protein BDZ97DRAFT_1905782 [Flammula alnicola]